MSRCLAIACAALPVACILPDLSLDGRACPCTDGYTCDAATNTCVADNAGANGPGANGPGGSGPGGAPSGGAPEGAGATGGAGGDSGGGPPTTGGDGSGGGEVVDVTAKPLIVSGGPPGTTTFEVADVFRLGVNDSDGFHQLTYWYDLATSQVLDLADNGIYSEHLYEAWALFDGTWYGSDNATSVSGQLVDEAPLRATFISTLDLPVSNGLEVTTRETVYASGKVTIHTTLRNTSGVPRSLDDSEYHHVTVNETVDWTVSNLGVHAAHYARVDGPQPFPNLIAINLDDDTDLYSDFPENRYWQYGPATLPAGGTVEKYAELIVSPGGLNLSDAAQHVDDVRDPQFEVASGGTAIGYARALGAFDVQVDSVPVRVGVVANRARYAPVFQLHGWTSPSYEIRRDGVLLANDQTRVGDGVIAYYDAASQTLAFTFLGRLPQGASDAERFFDVGVP